jgi:hypothetical protein
VRREKKAIRVHKAFKESRGRQEVLALKVKLVLRG